MKDPCCSTSSWLHGQSTVSTILLQKAKMSWTTPMCSYFHFYYQELSTTKYGFPSLDTELLKATTGSSTEASNSNKLTEKATGFLLFLFSLQQF